MTRDNRQILVNPHSSQEKIPVGALNLGEIAVQHNNVEDAALYVETVADSESADTVAKFITEKAIDSKIEDAVDLVKAEIDSINEAVGLPHDPEAWDSGLTVWQAIEQTYEEMTAGTAAASTKLHIDEAGGHEEKYLKLRDVKDDATSSITYYLKTEGVDERVESAVTIINETINNLSAATVEEIEKVVEKVEELSAATEDIVENIIDELNYTGVTKEGKPVINVTQENGLVAAETGNIDAQFVEVTDASGVTTTLDQAIDDIKDTLEDIEEYLETSAPTSEDGTIIVTVPQEGGAPDLAVNIDGVTLVKDAAGVISADLKLSSITPSSVNVKEEFALVDAEGNQLGDTVKVYKDSSLYAAQLGTMGDTLVSEDDPTIVPGTGDTALDLIYHKEDGTYELVKIDVNDFLEESEFKDGLEVDNHVVKVKVDPASEEVVIDDSGNTAPVLSVSEDGVKIANIQAAINFAVENLAGNIDADVTGASQDGKVTVEVVQENTELTQVVVTTDDIASAQELDNVEEAVGLNEDGTFTPDSASTYASAATSVRNEIQLIDQALKEVSEKLNAASVEKGTSVENFVKLGVTDDGEGATAITIDDSDLKQEIDFLTDDISTEAAAREEGDAALMGTPEDPTSANTIMGLKNLIAQIATNTVKSIEPKSGETLLDVTVTEGLEGDEYEIFSTQRLNDAVELAEASVQEVGFDAVATKDTTEYGSNAGAELVDSNNGGKKINLDLSTLKIDCGSY